MCVILCTNVSLCDLAKTSLMAFCVYVRSCFIFFVQKYDCVALLKAVLCLSACILVHVRCSVCKDIILGSLIVSACVHIRVRVCQFRHINYMVKLLPLLYGQIVAFTIWSNCCLYYMVKLLP